MGVFPVYDFIIFGLESERNPITNQLAISYAKVFWIITAILFICISLYGVSYLNDCVADINETGILWMLSKYNVPYLIALVLSSQL